MALSPGTRFGPYEVTDQIGAGGMGVVYRATDTTLDRNVAIKVLPESMASDAERIARFDREAKTLASLNHPNIAQIYGLERSDGTTALVMELVEGPTLADRIEKGAIPADEALGIAMQIAEALEAAHGQGIVHRDLKPANVKLRPDGTVKVLDFGIAKALEPENLTTGPQSPMMTTPATMAGVILGTAAYMSPEQAKGKHVDQRTDIWAFGCLLYEMLTGQLAFGAEDVPTTLARVIANETDLDSLPSAVSPAVRETIRLCLQKDARKRLHAMGDVRLLLEGAFDVVSPRETETPTVARPIWRQTLSVAAAVVVGGVIVGAVVWVGMEPAPSVVSRFNYDLPEGQSLRATGWPVIAVSPDGAQFVYNTNDGLYLRAMNELEARLISGTEPPSDSIVFSPDGRSVAYWDISGQLKRIATSGGAAVPLTDLESDIYGISWQTDGTILYGQDNGIYRVSANGGTPERLIPVGGEGELFYGAELLPDGDSVLFSIATLQGGTWNTAQVVAQSLSTGERTGLVSGGSDARYVSTGHLIYAFEDGLFAVAFDPDTLTVSGGTVPIVQGVMRADSGQTGTANYGVSQNGTLFYLTGTVAAAQRTLVWVDRSGREEPLGLPPRAYHNPKISPDGTTIAVDVRDQDDDIWISDLARMTLTRLTTDPGQDEFPVWSPNGQRIVSSSGNSTLLWRAADGSGVVEALVESTGQIFATSFLPDASGILVFGTVTSGNGDDIAIFRFEGENPVTPLLETMFEESYPAVSPGGLWLAYVSDDSGSEEVYVRPFPDVNAGGRTQVSTSGGTQPLWSRDGSELFYRTGEALVAVPIRTDPTFMPGTPEVVFEDDYVLQAGGPNYDVSPEVDRFLMIKENESASESPQVIVVQNWFEELELLVPTE